MKIKQTKGYQLRRALKLILVIVSVIIMMLSVCSCSINRTVNVKYGVCSKSYNCDSEGMHELSNPVHFVLPKNHKTMTVEFHTTETFGFVGDITDAKYYIPAYGKKYSTNLDTIDLSSMALDAINSGLDVAIAYYDAEKSDGVVRRVAEIISGYKSGNYYFDVYDQDGNNIKTGMLPVGTTTMILSSKVQRVDIYSYLDVGEHEYKKAEYKKGTVAYENASEVGDLENNKTASEEFPLDASKRFVLCSGAGGWSNTLYLRQDGSFEGKYYDRGYIVDNSGYENIGICEYRGAFKIKKHEGQIYSLEVEKLEYDQNIGQSWIEDGIKYIRTKPYGIETGKEFHLYVPGIQVNKLPNDFVTWSYTHLQKELSGTDKLPCYGLYNVDQHTAFYSHDD